MVTDCVTKRNMKRQKKCILTFMLIFKLIRFLYSYLEFTAGDGSTFSELHGVIYCHEIFPCSLCIFCMSWQQQAWQTGAEILNFSSCLWGPPCHFDSCPFADRVINEWQLAVVPGSSTDQLQVVLAQKRSFMHSVFPVSSCLESLWLLEFLVAFPKASNPSDFSPYMWLTLFTSSK